MSRVGCHARARSATDDRGAAAAAAAAAAADDDDDGDDDDGDGDDNDDNDGAPRSRTRCTRRSRPSAPEERCVAACRKGGSAALVARVREARALLLWRTTGATTMCGSANKPRALRAHSVL